MSRVVDKKKELALDKDTSQGDSSFSFIALKAFLLTEALSQIKAMIFSPTSPTTSTVCFRMCSKKQRCQRIHWNEPDDKAISFHQRFQHERQHCFQLLCLGYPQHVKWLPRNRIVGFMYTSSNMRIKFDWRPEYWDMTKLKISWVFSIWVGWQILQNDWQGCEDVEDAEFFLMLGKIFVHVQINLCKFL